MEEAGKGWAGEGVKVSPDECVLLQWRSLDSIAIRFAHIQGVSVETTSSFQ